MTYDDDKTDTEVVVVAAVVVVVDVDVGAGDGAIAQFAITINSNVCPHIRVLNTLMRESYA